jgi:4-diphosphocytidyl-2-C-methyl-D-erythritol kinase
MQPLSLADDLWVRPGPDLRLECDHPEVPAGSAKPGVAGGGAVRGGLPPGAPVFHFRLVKKIPVAAGLGGGSSDAAGALLALNDLAGQPLEMATLHALAAELGADVPFFLRTGPAVGRGIGTELSPLTCPPTGMYY